MKSIKEIQNQVAFEYGWVDWICFLSDCPDFEKDVVFTEVTKRYATEYGKEVQRLCAEKTVKEYVRPRTLNYAEIADLILSEDNLPSHE